MDTSTAPQRCLLCNHVGVIRAAGFRQLYKQRGAAPLCLPWWECLRCRGWFAFPLPTPAEIESHCARDNYNDPRQAASISAAKKMLTARLLSQLERRTAPGPLLDFGCSFGELLLLARAAGWRPSGFEPYGLAAREAAAKGFDVRCEWVLDKAEFPDNHFAALTAIDSFGYVWNPYETLSTFYRLLQPGGTLAMRLSNKQWIMRLVRTFRAGGPRRNEQLTDMATGQFHAIDTKPLRTVLQDIGFDRVVFEPFATTAQWKDLSRGTRLAYTLSQVAYAGSLGKVQLSPGVLLFAQKPS